MTAHILVLLAFSNEPELSLKSANALWVTPLFVFTLNREIAEQLNTVLAAAAIKARDQCSLRPMAPRPESHPVSAVDGPNHAFFSEQQRRYREGKLPFEMDDKAAAAYLHLQTHVHKAVIKVLQAYEWHFRSKIVWFCLTLLLQATSAGIP